MQVKENSSKPQNQPTQVSSEELKVLTNFFATLLDWSKEEKQFKTKESK